LAFLPIFGISIDLKVALFGTVQNQKLKKVSGEKIPFLVRSNPLFA